MSHFNLFAIACLVLSVICLLLAMRAPVGYEDQNGFHYGEPAEIPDREDETVVEDDAPTNAQILNSFPKARETGVILEQDESIILIRKGKAHVFDKAEFGFPLTEE